MSVPAKVRSNKAVEADTYHGIPVLGLHVSDPIPVPRAPERFAVRVYPDLARHLLGLNHENNRRVRERSVRRYVSDMREGLWWFTPEPVVFSQSGVLQNGQHRLVAVTEYGSDVWMMFDFGWPDDIINAIDRGANRTNQDAFAIERIPSAATITAAIALRSRYDQVVGQSRGFSALPTPTAQQSLAIYRAAPDEWAASVTIGRRVYDHLDKGLTPTIWTAMHRLVADIYPTDADAFFNALADGTDDPGNPTRVLGDWFRRRPSTATRTGDGREPVELIIRGFNAWRAGRTVAVPKVPGFTLSRVK